MAGAGVTNWAAPHVHPLALLGVIGSLGINWFGDSLDGTLARVRDQQRPRYGFYVDHVVDCIGAAFLLGGLALSGFMTPIVAIGVLAAYLLVSAETYLATYALAEFRMSRFGVGPTELRLLLAAGTLALLTEPSVSILGGRYQLFDVGGVAAIAGMVVAMVTAAVRNGVALYRAEPLPPRRAERV
jgi:archaetidylinositol phosphate synthase